MANINTGLRIAYFLKRRRGRGGKKEAVLPGQVGLLARYRGSNINLLNNVGVVDGSSVATWKNEHTTGATYDLTQGTAGLRPVFRLVADGTKINGKSAVESVGARQLVVAFPLVNQPLTWMWVFKNTAVGTQVISSGNTNTNQTLTSGTTFQLYAGTGQTPALTHVANKWETLIVRFDGANSTATLNGVTVSGFGTLGTLGLDSISMFWNAAQSGGADMIGLIAEMAIWTTPPTIAEITAYSTAAYGATPQ